MRKLFVLGLMLSLSACELPEAHTSTVVLPEPDSAGAKLVKEYCSDCHAPPAPSVHVAKEWPNVIYRMQERRRMKAYNMMNEQQVEVMVKYLQQHAKG